MSTEREAAIPAEDFGTGIHDRKWQRLRLARSESDEGDQRRSLEICHISDIPGSRYTLRKPADVRLRGSTPTKSETSDRSDDAPGYGVVPPILSPERHAVVRWKRAKWNNSITMKRNRLEKRRNAAASIVSFWQRSTRKTLGPHPRACTPAAETDDGKTMCHHHPWKRVWARSTLCAKCGLRVSDGTNMLGCFLCDQVAHRSCHIRDVVAHLAILCGEIIQQIDEEKDFQDAALDSSKTVGGGNHWVCRHCLGIARPASKAQQHPPAT